MMQKLILLLQILPLVLLLSCKEKELLEASGRYHGDLIVKGNKDKVLLEFPLLSKDSIKGSFLLYMSSTSEISRQYDLTINLSKNKLLVSSHKLGIKNAIELVEDCAFDKNKKNNQYCFSPSSLQIEVISPIKISLKVKKIKTLPFISSKKSYTKSDLLLQAKFMNYEVQGEALKSFESYNKMKSAKLQLLPKISLGSALDLALDGPAGLIGAAGDLLPFLFPSNWFKKEAAKELFYAQKYSYGSVRANSMSVVESLYYIIQRDQIALTKLERHLEWLTSLHKVLEQEEADFILPKGSTLFFERHLLALSQEKTLLTSTLAQETATLAQAVGLPPLEGVKILDLSPSEYKLKKVKLDGKKLFSKASENSLELKTLEALINAAKLDIKGVRFSFLDPSVDALGFSYGTEIEIAKSEVEQLKLSYSEVKSKIQEKILHHISLNTEYENTLLEFERLYEIGQLKVSKLIQTHINAASEMDEEELIEDLVESSFELLEYDISKSNVLFSHLVNQAKIERLILEGSYANLEINTPF